MPSQRRPNFLIIVADDLGFSDIGCFGSEISTPHIDSLAAGIRFTDFHTASACSPTRSMLLSGTDNHIAGVGNMAEYLPRFPQHRGQPGHEGYLNNRVAALPEVLHDNGYFTLITGKWHLGLTKDLAPWTRGFQKSFSLLPGAANHYAFEPQLEEGSNVPGVLLGTPSLYIEGSEFCKTLPDNFYSSDTFVDKFIEYMDARSDSQRDQPFFAYLPFSAPHWPLQAPDENIAHYKGMYNNGPEALRLQRLDKLKELGLIGEDVEPHPIVDYPRRKGHQQWEDMSELERRRSSKSMEAYAGMVERMDVNIGRALDYLKKSGEYDNTMIMFFSDNGAEGALMEAIPVMGPHLMKHIDTYYDNSLDNIGRKNSYVWYGSRWAQSATAPSKLYKCFTTEGGIRVCCLAQYSGWKVCQSHISDKFCTVMDIMPTILDMASIRHPAPIYKGRNVAPMRGTSLVPYLTGQADDIHGEDYITGWELFGRAAIRMGKWKAVFLPEPWGPERWQLYRLDIDPGEINDLSEKEPAKFQQLMDAWDKYVQETGAIGGAPEYGEIRLMEDDIDFEDQVLS